MIKTFWQDLFGVLNIIFGLGTTFFVKKAISIRQNILTLCGYLNCKAAYFFYYFYQLMRTLAIGVAVAAFLCLGAIFMYRSSQTKTYYTTAGKLLEVTPQMYSKEHLYKDVVIQPIPADTLTRLP